MYFLTFHLLWPSTPLASMQSLLLPFHIKHILAPLLICAKVKTPKKHVAYIETERETAPRNGKKGVDRCKRLLYIYTPPFTAIILVSLLQRFPKRHFLITYHFFFSMVFNLATPDSTHPFLPK